MTGLSILPSAAPTLSPPTLDKVVGALALLLQRATEVELAVEDVVQELFLVGSQELRVDAARVQLADGDEVWFGDGDPVRAGEQRRSAQTVEPSLVGLGSLVSMPLLAGGKSWGVIDLYRSTAGIWTDNELAHARSFASIVAHSISFVTDRAPSGSSRGEHRPRATHELTSGPDNRRLLFDRLDQALLTASRRRRAVAVLSVGIDGFDDITATMGRSFADLLLAEVERRLRLTLRAGDTLSRLSGDEFVAVCEDLHGAPAQINQRLAILGRRIQRELRRPPHAGEIEVVVSVSIGIAVSTYRRGAEDLIGEADRARCQARTRGRRRLLISDGAVVTAVAPSAGRRAARGRQGPG